jgi:hypothetical protein
MATVRNVEVLSEEFNVGKICTVINKFFREESVLICNIFNLKQ